MTKCAVKKVSKLYMWFEFTYPEMQRKHITRSYKYQLSTSSHHLITDIKHRPDTLLVNV